MLEETGRQWMLHQSDDPTNQEINKILFFDFFDFLKVQKVQKGKKVQKVHDF